MEDVQLGETITGSQLHISKTWTGPESDMHRGFCGRRLYHIFEQAILVDLDDLNSKNTELKVKDKPVCSRCLFSFKEDRRFKKINEKKAPATQVA